MCDRCFNIWFDTMTNCINSYSYYVDFEKVYYNVNSIRVQLNILNSLIGSRNIEADFRSLLIDYPEILKCIPILLAVRSREIYAQDEQGAFCYDFDNMNYGVDQYIVFMRKSGLLDLIGDHVVNNLVDYVIGVETGLESNGRKNRGGHQMEKLVEEYIQRTGVEYYKEMYLSDVESKWKVDLSAISAHGTSTKRWDFVVKTVSSIFVVETNFYATSGSKLNETARSYKMIAEEVRNISGVDFVWVTDGAGWKNARGNLEETFNVMTHLYNINDMNEGVFDVLFH